MRQSKRLYWLSSYPKSGNTWFRIFLANLLSLSKNENNQSLNVNQVDGIINDKISTDRIWVNQVCGFNTAWLTDDEVDALMPTIYSWYNAQQSNVTYHKIHRAYTYVNKHQPLIPLNNCFGAIYFIRNPLDISISLANHFFCSIDDAINMMGDTSFALYYYPLRQLILSWSMHVDSWVGSNAANLLVLRYEDMISDPFKIFTQAVGFLQLNVDSSIVEQAIASSTFEKLKQFEDDVGFMDKPPRLKHFFRKGIAGDWQNTLTTNQIQRIISDHGDVMRKFGYLNQQNEPTIG